MSDLPERIWLNQSDINRVGANIPAEDADNGYAMYLRADTIPTVEELESIIMGKAVTDDAGLAAVDAIMNRIKGGKNDQGRV